MGEQLPVAGDTAGRVIVCGGRDYADRARVYRCLDALRGQGRVALVVHGAASGADSLAGAWARERGVPEERHPADWGRLGRGAGPLRNQKMADLGAELLVAFPGGRGTDDMVRRAEAAGIQVWRLTERPRS